VTAASAETTTTVTTIVTTTEPETTTTTTVPVVVGRTITEQNWVPMVVAGDVVVVHPARIVEHIGFHQSNHEGAQQMDPLPTAVRPFTMEARDRLSADRTAVDVVVDPDVEIRAPVTGTVIAAQTYVLYCKYYDDLAIIEPDSHPGWQVKMLHISDVQVAVGDRVVAGETVIAPHAHQLPFESQVDESRTADPAWPHVHIEVIDPSIPNVPNPGSGGC